MVATITPAIARSLDNGIACPSSASVYYRPTCTSHGVSRHIAFKATFRMMVTSVIFLITTSVITLSIVSSPPRIFLSNLASTATTHASGRDATITNCHLIILTTHSTN